MDVLCNDVYTCLNPLVLPFGQIWTNFTSSIQVCKETEIKHFRKWNQASSENDIIGFISADQLVGLSESLHFDATNVSNSMDKW